MIGNLHPSIEKNNVEQQFCLTPFDATLTMNGAD